MISLNYNYTYYNFMYEARFKLHKCKHNVEYGYS